LLTDGHEVVCLLRARSDASGLAADAKGAAPEGHFSIVRGHLGRPDTYKAALAGCDVVYHVAAEMRGAVAVLFMTNVVATRAFLEAARQAEVSRFVLVSSFSVYGTAHLARGATLDETCSLETKPHLRDPYAFSKTVQERVAWEVHRDTGLPLVVVRPGVIYGPGRDWITGRVGLRLGSLLIKMGGRQAVPYTYVDNCADAVYRGGTVPGIDGQAFNVVDDDPPSVNALVRRYRRQIGRLRVIPIPSWAIGPLSRTSEWYHSYSKGQLPAILSRYRSDAQWKRLVFSNEKARRELGWRPTVTFEQGLDRTAKSLAARPGAAS
jgi:nucleoside-diphosphate-sugar epimerase